MFLRHRIRRKDGKVHRAWSVVENRRAQGGRVVQRQALYLGEINDSQRAAWSRAIAVFDEGGQSDTNRAVSRGSGRAGSRLRRGFDSAEPDAVAPPTSVGACWLAMVLWDQLRLDDFWRPALPP